MMEGNNAKGHHPIYLPNVYRKTWPWSFYIEMSVTLNKQAITQKTTWLRVISQGILIKPPTYLRATEMQRHNK